MISHESAASRAYALKEQKLPDASVEARINVWMSKLPPQKLYNALYEAVRDFFITSNDYTKKDWAEIQAYLTRCRGIFTEQIKKYQREAQNTAENTQSVGSETLPTLYPLLVTFVHDYIFTPIGLPALISADTSQVREKKVHELLSLMDQEIRIQHISENAEKYAEHLKKRTLPTSQS